MAIGSPTRGILLGTLLLAGAAAGYSLRYGSNLPHGDEWELVGHVLRGETLSGWFLEPHNCHRYPLGKLLWALTLSVSGYDFRVGMLVTVALLTGASLLLTDAARRIRGFFSLGDLAIPALIFHWGHGFNLLMSYQIVFALFTLGMAGVAWSATRVRAGKIFGPAMGSGAFAFLAVQSGGFGLAVSPALVGWHGYLAWKQWREPGPGRRWKSAAIAGIASGLSAYTAWIAGTFRPDEAASGHGLGAAGLAIGVLHYLACGFGDVPATAGPRAAVLALTAIAYLAAGVSVAIGVRNPTTRSVAVGLGCLLLAQFAVALAVTWGRGQVVGGRFVTPSAVGLGICWVALAQWTLEWRFLRLGSGLAVAFLVVGLNAGAGNRYGSQIRATVKSFEADMRAGMPPIFLAGKHGGGLPFLLTEHLGETIRTLRDRGIGPFRQAAIDPPLEVIPLSSEEFPPRSLTCPSDPFRPGGPPPPRVRIPDPGREVSGVRLSVVQHHPMGYQVLRLRWKERGSGAERTAEVTPLVVPGRGTVTFRIGCEPTELWLEPGCPMAGLTLENAAWLAEGR